MPRAGPHPRVPMPVPAPSRLRRAAGGPWRCPPRAGYHDIGSPRNGLRRLCPALVRLLSLRGFAPFACVRWRGREPHGTAVLIPLLLSVFLPRSGNQASHSGQIRTAHHLAPSSESVRLFFWKPIQNVLRSPFVLQQGWQGAVLTHAVALGWSTSIPCPAGPVRMATLVILRS